MQFSIIFKLYNRLILLQKISFNVRNIFSSIKRIQEYTYIHAHTRALLMNSVHNLILSIKLLLTYTIFFLNNNLYLIIA